MPTIVHKIICNHWAKSTKCVRKLLKVQKAIFRFKAIFRIKGRESRFAKMRLTTLSYTERVMLHGLSWSFVAGG